MLVASNVSIAFYATDVNVKNNGNYRKNVWCSQRRHNFLLR